LSILTVGGIGGFVLMNNSSSTNSNKPAANVVISTPDVTPTVSPTIETPTQSVVNNSVTPLREAVKVTPTVKPTIQQKPTTQPQPTTPRPQSKQTVKPVPKKTSNPDCIFNDDCE